MTKVTMYQANDGSLHKKPAERDAKNIELRTAPLIEEFVSGLGNQEVGVTYGAESVYIDLAELPTFLVAHADTLRVLLNRAVQPAGRPRKAKDGAEKPPRKPRASKPATPPVVEDKPADPPPVVESKPAAPTDVEALLDGLQ